MFLYVYIILFLFIFTQNNLLCYEYSNVLIEHKGEKVEFNKGATKRHTRKAQRLSHDHSEPLTQIDVSNFLQPESDASELMNPYAYHSDSQTINLKHPPIHLAERTSLDYLSSDVNNGDSVNLAKLHNRDMGYPKKAKMRTFSVVVSNERKRNQAIDEAYKRHNIYQRQPNEENNYIISKKKCPCKRMKFPFFSHKFHNPINDLGVKDKHHEHKSNYTEANSLMLQEDKSLSNEKKKNVENKEAFENDETSYVDRLCPRCRRNFIEQVSKRKGQDLPMIHNSRQYNPYKDMASVDTSTKVHEFDEDNNLFDLTEFRGDDEEVKYHNRVKRDYEVLKDKSEEIKDRQLKELEEVERKVNNVEIKTPNLLDTRTNSEKE